MLMATGCLPTYVGDPETAVVDPKLIGLWHRQDETGNDVWAVHRMNDHNYLIQSYRVENSADKRVIRSSLMFRGWVSTIAGQTFLSLETYSVPMLQNPDAMNNRYIVARINLDEEQVRVRGINPEFLKGQSTNGPQDLEKLIQDNLENPQLYAQELVYQKVTPMNQDNLKSVIDVIR
ncbi:MAG: hypothetical protein KatS3mg104_0326 [Phycisphaerae bacterium]|nr:MAG: hypothetical protein KatS3mg104_0326 [Phycisphaerae bacterium]